MSEPPGRRTSRWYHDPFVRWTSGRCRFGRDPMGELSKIYMPTEVEGSIYERWLAADVFAPDGAGSTADPDLPPFTIIQPPPNVTGSLHLGHAQRTAVEDLMIRHARMRGHTTLFLPGARPRQHRGAGGPRCHPRQGGGEPGESLGRERYLERMRAFSDSTKPVMLGQQRRVGGSFDWGRLRYTMDEGSATAVRVAFDRLYRRRPRLPDRGPRQLVPRLPDERERPRGHLHARDRHAVDGALPPDRRGHGRAGSGRLHQRGHDPSGDDPRRHRRSRCTPTIRATRTSSVGG